MGILFLATGCTVESPFATPTPPPPPEATISFGPTPPLKPEGIGAGLGEPRAISEIEDAIACLADGQPVYVLLQNNTGVFASPAADACQVGRTAAGSLVRVESIYQQGEPQPLVSLDRRQRVILASAADPVGYAEDIQPLFERTCASCHGDAVKTLDLQVTEYEALMAGSSRGPVVSPGDPDDSKLWELVSTGKMPLVGELAPEQKRLVFDWIAAGAPAVRPEPPQIDDLWLQISAVDFNAIANTCAGSGADLLSLISANQVTIASCVAAPSDQQLAQLRPSARPGTQTASLQSDISTTDEVQSAPNGEASVDTVESPSEAVENQPESTEGEAEELAPEAPAVAASAPPVLYATGQANISAAPLGLPAPSEADPWMIPRGGFCVEQRLQQKLEQNYGITSLAFAPDGRLFIGLDAPSTGDADPNVLFDAFHPSRSVVVYNSASGDDYYNEILSESGRVTGMVWYNGALYLNRAGEVGRIPDGGSYERLASGFAVNGRLFHANNGIAVVDGWLYVSAGGVRDGYSDGIIAPGDGEVPAETLAANIAGGGNTFAARLVRAPLDRLLSERTIGVFQTAARGFRNPYGLASDPAGRLWITDNGATNVGEEYFAGDEVNLFEPRSLPPEAAAGNESATPFYGFPMALSGMWKDWWTGPVVALPNTTAPTGITWANGTIYFAQYGRNPGLYRLASSGGQVIAERVLLGWPIQAVTTAPDGAIWIGTGNGGLYRVAPGCG